MFLNSTAQISQQKNMRCPSTSSQWSPHVAWQIAQPFSATFKLSTPLQTGHQIPVEIVNRPKKRRLYIFHIPIQPGEFLDQAQGLFRVPYIRLVPLPQERLRLLRYLLVLQYHRIKISDTRTFTLQLPVRYQLQAMHRSHPLNPVIIPTDTIPDTNSLPRILQSRNPKHFFPI